MSPSLFIAVLTFSLVSAFTPGPNNLLALASGANWGYRRTLPHVFGVAVGYAIMLALMGAGLGSLFKAAPIAQEILKWLAIAYLTFLAWKIATSTGIDDSSTSKESKPITFLGSAAFQWINPKAWIAAITIVTTFTIPHSYWTSLLICGATNVGIALCAVSSWALFGTIVKNWLSNPVRLRIFNWSMAALLLVSVLPSVFSIH